MHQSFGDSGIERSLAQEAPPHTEQATIAFMASLKNAAMLDRTPVDVLWAAWLNLFEEVRTLADGFGMGGPDRPREERELVERARGWGLLEPPANPDKTALRRAIRNDALRVSAFRAAALGDDRSGFSGNAPEIGPEPISARHVALSSSPAPPPVASPVAPPRAPPPAHDDMAPPKLDAFDGSGNAREWVGRAEFNFRASDTPEGKWALYASGALVGPAFDWVAGAKPEVWKDFAEGLAARFGDAAEADRAAVQIARLRCGSLEGFEAFDRAFASLALKLRPAPDAAERRRLYLAGLPDELYKEAIRLGNGATQQEVRDQVAAVVARALVAQPVVAVASVPAPPLTREDIKAAAREALREAHDEPVAATFRARPQHGTRGDGRRGGSGNGGGGGARRSTGRRDPAHDACQFSGENISAEDARSRGVCRVCKRPWAKSDSASLRPSSPATPLHHASVGALVATSQDAVVAAGAPTTALIFVPASIGGAAVRALVDSGATHCVLSRARAEGLRLTLTDGPQIALADGRRVPSAGRCPLEVAVGDSRVNLEVLVADVGFEAILGLSWLRATGVAVDWASGHCTFPARSPDSHPQGATAEPRMATILAAEIEPDDEVYLLVIHAVEPQRKTSPGIAKLVERFRGSLFLDELPPGLPPSRPSGDFVIDLDPPDARPRVRPLPRFSPNQETKIATEVEALLRKGFVKPSDSPFGAQVLFVKKKDGSERMCLDYRALNDVTVPDQYPLPIIDTLLPKLSGKKVFSHIDLRDAFHQVRVAPADTHKTAFRTPMGSYEFLVLPFGLRNAPSAFSRMIEQALPTREFGDCTCKYVDDLFVMSDDMATHERDLERVFERLLREKLYPKAEKCRFGLGEVTFLGHVVSADGIRPDPAKTKALTDAPPPADVPALRRFLGLSNYFSSFVPRYAARARALFDLLPAAAAWTWGGDQQAAFDDLKRALSSPPVLRPFNRDLAVTIQTDASGRGLGAVLLQDDGRGLRPVAFAAHRLSRTETQYPAQQLELFAIVYALEHWRHFCVGRKVTVQTDHLSLSYLRKQPDPHHRLSRWFEALQEFDYEITYRPGATNKIADWLSRDAAPLSGPTIATLVRVAVDDKAFLQRVREGYAQDPYFAPLVKALGGAPVAGTIRERAERFTLEDGLLFFKETGALAVPKNAELRRLILTEIHGAGHFGVDKTYDALRSRFFWPHMGKTTKKHVQQCDLCQHEKGAARSSNGLLMPLPIPERPWACVSMDFTSGLPVTPRGHDNVLVVVDRFTKMAHYIPTTTTVTAQGTAQLFFDHVFRLHGLPREIVSDRDPLFTSQFWQALWVLVGTRLAMSTANHAKTDGQSEAANKTLGQLLRVFCRDRPADWDLSLPLLEYFANAATSRSTGVSPFYANYGFEPALPADLLAGSVLAVGTPGVNDLVERLSSIHRLVRDNIRDAQDEQAAATNKTRREVEFRVGDSVLVSSEVARPGTVTSDAGKFAKGFHGPYSVIGVVNKNAVRLGPPFPATRHSVVNVEFVKQYVKDEDAPAPVGPDERGHTEVQSLLKSRVRRGKTEYLVRWQGHQRNHDEWLPLDHLSDAADLVREFDRLHPAPVTRASSGRGRV